MKKLIAIILTLVSVLSCFACGEQTPPPSTGQNKGIQTVNDYENIYDLNTMLFSGVLGKVDLSTDANFVKKGKSSAKVTVESNPYKSGQPTLFQSFEMPKHDLDLTDFSKTLALKLSVYSEQEQNTPFSLQLTYEYSAGARKWYTLKKGWNELTLNVSREYLPETTDSEGNDILKVTGVKLLFDRPEKTEEDAVYYIDDFRMYFTEKPYSPVVMRLKDNEIASFDDEWQVEFLTIEAKDYLTPQVYLDTNIKNGSGSSLRIETTPGNDSYIVTEQWPGVRINEDQLSLVAWDEYAPTARLCFDVYVPEENGVDELWLSMYSEGYLRYFSGDAINPVPGQWKTFSYTVEELNSGWECIQGERDFAHTQALALRWGEYVGEPRTIYIDNIRMEN